MCFLIPRSHESPPYLASRHARHVTCHHQAFLTGYQFHDCPGSRSLLSRRAWSTGRLRLVPTDRKKVALSFLVCPSANPGTQLTHSQVGRGPATPRRGLAPRLSPTLWPATPRRGLAPRLSPTLWPAGAPWCFSFS
jgi:hypothetical protein